MSVSIRVRAIEAGDDRALGRILERLMRDHGALREGAAADPELAAMSAAYGGSRAVYFVGILDGDLAGGAGIGPLLHGPGEVCELRKMYLTLGARGHGLGRALLSRCLDAARRRGYQQCFLQTMRFMLRAQQVYERAGFRRVATTPEGVSVCGSACDRYYLLDL